MNSWLRPTDNEEWQESRKRDRIKIRKTEGRKNEDTGWSVMKVQNNLITTIRVIQSSPLYWILVNSQNVPMGITCQMKDLLT